MSLPNETTYYQFVCAVCCKTSGDTKPIFECLGCGGDVGMVRSIAASIRGQWPAPTRFHPVHVVMN